MVSLTTQTGKINAVISLKDINIETINNNILKSLKVWCENNCQLFAFILHDKDILEDGEKKTNHIHLVALMKTNRKRLSTILGDLASFLGLNTFAISIDKMSDIVGSLQYLVHKNNADKHKYELAAITTNISSGEMATYMTSDSKSMSIEYLIGVVESNRSKIEIMRIVGLTYYHLYRHVINDIYNEIYNQSYIKSRDWLVISRGHKSHKRTL